MKKLSIAFILFIAGCTGLPDNVKPVDNFELEKYLGKWYEIARLDHSFERGGLMGVPIELTNEFKRKMQV